MKVNGLKVFLMNKSNLMGERKQKEKRNNKAKFNQQKNF